MILWCSNLKSGLDSITWLGLGGIAWSGLGSITLSGSGSIAWSSSGSIAWSGLGSITWSGSNCLILIRNVSVRTDHLDLDKDADLLSDMSLNLFFQFMGWTVAKSLLWTVGRTSRYDLVDYLRHMQ